MRSRSDSVGFALVAVLVVVGSVLIEWLTQPWVGLLVFASAFFALIGVATAAYLSTVSQDRPVVARRRTTTRSAASRPRRRRRSSAVGRHAHRHGTA